jgi:hypothetical protein
MRRLLLGVGALALLALAGLLIPRLLPPRPGVTRANYGRLHEGLTPAEVKDILGRGPDLARHQNPPSTFPLAEGCWEGEGFTITVYFDWDERVSGKYLTERDSTFLGRLRRLLRWDANLVLR